MKLFIKSCASSDATGWLTLRQELWPESDRAQHLLEMNEICANRRRNAAFLARIAAGVSVGFAEVSVRLEGVNGAGQPPVGFLEGLYVTASARRQGVARALVSAAESWVAAKGCRVLASDVDLGNDLGLLAHRALGFDETERAVFFRKPV